MYIKKEVFIMRKSVVTKTEIITDYSKMDYNKYIRNDIDKKITDYADESSENDYILVEDDSSIYEIDRKCLKRLKNISKDTNTPGYED